MSCKLWYLVCLLAVSLVSAEQNVVSKQNQSIAVDLNDSTKESQLINVPPQLSEKMQQEMKVPAKMKMDVKMPEMMEISSMKPMQVTGFITASGSIFEVDDKKSVGQIEARQNGQLLTPQAGEFICNYGSVVVYSDRPCEDVMSIKKPMKQKGEKGEKEPNKSVKTETDKEKDQKQAAVVSEQPQADDNTAVDSETVQNENETAVEQANKPMRKNKKKKKKTKKNKNKKNTQKRKQNGVRKIRVKTRQPVRRNQLQQQGQQQYIPLRRTQNSRRRGSQQQQKQRQSQKRRRPQLKRQGAYYTTPNGKLYKIIEVIQ